MNTNQRLLAIGALITLTLMALVSSFDAQVLAQGKGKGKPGGGDDGGNPVTNAAFAYEEASSLGILVTSIDGAEVQALTSPEEGAGAMVRLEQTFEPEASRQTGYDAAFARYRRLWAQLEDVLRHAPTA